jgi:hypothetical protein
MSVVRRRATFPIHFCLSNIGVSRWLATPSTGKKGYPKLSFSSLLITINIMAETIIGEPVTVSLNDLKTGEMSIPRKGLDHYADTTWVRLHQF